MDIDRIGPHPQDDDPDHLRTVWDDVWNRATVGGSQNPVQAPNASRRAQLASTPMEDTHARGNPKPHQDQDVSEELALICELATAGMAVDDINALAGLMM
jgi:hypothetical protein